MEVCNVTLERAAGRYECPGALPHRSRKGEIPWELVII